jgi:hypothetical protein
MTSRMLAFTLASLALSAIAGPNMIFIVTRVPRRRGCERGWPRPLASRLAHSRTWPQPPRAWPRSSPPRHKDCSWAFVDHDRRRAEDLSGATVRGRRRRECTQPQSRPGHGVSRSITARFLARTHLASGRSIRYRWNVAAGPSYSRVSSGSMPRHAGSGRGQSGIGGQLSVEVRLDALTEALTIEVWRCSGPRGPRA